jgi:AraC-like DNA-binding protein
MVHGEGLVRLFLDVKSAAGETLASRFRALPTQVVGATRNTASPTLLDRVWQALTEHQYARAAGSILAAFGVPKPAATPHPAVAKAVEYLNRFDRELPTATDLIKLVGIPAARMYSLFARDLGMSIGTYARWQRLRRFCVALTHSSDWGDAALRAGFRPPFVLADTVDRMFGLSESALDSGWWIAP